ncbi:MAG: hypothetical protein JWL61_2120 [Gemmatimonadetes bacterium]|nr:hypothetical protein [Gemmatimonadota bacterium]
MVWSLWIGKFPKPVSWLLGQRYKELRHAFALVLEFNGFVAILGSNIGDIDSLISDDRVPYAKFLALRSDDSAEIDSISTRNLRAGRVGVVRSSQTGRHLERSLSRIGANQTAASQVSLRQDDEAWKVAPGSGRVSQTGNRSSIPELCSWFATTCGYIDNAAEPHEFIRAFAHPVELDQLPAPVVPTSVQLDSGLMDDLLEAGSTLHRAGIPMNDAELLSLRELVGQLWMVEPVRTSQDEDAKIWRLKAAGTEVGHLVMRTTKISFVSPQLAEVQTVNQDEPTSTLAKAFNDASQPLRITFSEPSYGYAAGQLFRDHRLIASRTTLLEALADRLPADASVEKGNDATGFLDASLFGYVVNSGSSDDDLLVCDDIGTEWADFIGVSTADHTITFYHCKGGHVDVGASGLHEVVAQAAKNLGYLTATYAELESRKEKWAGLWNGTQIHRLQRGLSADAFIAAFTKAVSAPQSTRRVTIVTSSLSKSAVAAAFEDIANGESWPEATHVLWLLLGFVDQCRTIGAVPEIICRP